MLYASEHKRKQEYNKRRCIKNRVQFIESKMEK